MTKKRNQTTQTLTDVAHAITPLPQTVDAAIAFLNACTAPEVVAEIKATSFESLIQFHRDIGMQVRNVLGLWGRNPVLVNSLPKERQWPDDAAMHIIEAWWLWLQDNEPAAGKRL